MELTSDCKAVVKGCVIIKPFKTATAKVKLAVNGMTLFQTTQDVCKIASRIPAMARGIISMFGLPDSCPVAEGNICINNQSLDVSLAKPYLGMVRGKVEIDVSVEHDNGKSCYKVAVELTK